MIHQMESFIFQGVIISIWANSSGQFPLVGHLKVGGEK